MFSVDESNPFSVGSVNNSSIGSALNTLGSSSASSVVDPVSTGAGVLGSIINAITGSITTGMNIAAQKDINNSNLQFQREVQDYTKALQERIFQREDDAVQRRALDLEKAGLSKTLAAGSSANAGQALDLTSLHSDYNPDYSGFSQAAMAAFDFLMQSKKTSSEAAYFDSMAQLNREEERGKRITNDINEAFGYDSASADYQLSLGKLEELNVNLDNLKSQGQLTKANIIRTLTEAGVNSATISKIESQIENQDADTALKTVQKELVTENVTDAKFWNETNVSNRYYYDTFGVPTSRSGNPITTFDGVNLSIPSVFGFGISRKGFKSALEDFPSESELQQQAKFTTQNGFVDWLSKDYPNIEPAMINYLLRRYNGYFKTQESKPNNVKWD